MHNEYFYHNEPHNDAPSVSVREARAVSASHDESGMILMILADQSRAPLQYITTYPPKGLGVVPHELAWAVYKPLDSSKPTGKLVRPIGIRSLPP